MRTIEGSRRATGFRFALVVSKYNDFVTDRLQAGALAALAASGVGSDDITVIRVPGAFEIPLAAQHAAESGRFDAIVCLGCLIRGETSHYELIAGECAAGIQRVQLELTLPVVFGVLTTENLAQALARAGGASGNKGAEAAATAIEMANVLRVLEQTRPGLSADVRPRPKTR